MENVPVPEITIALLQAEERVLVSVSDNGLGIPQDLQNDLFKPFVTTKKKGTGLGLVFSRKMITKMNGTIEAESDTRKGTTMLITLPAAENTEAPL